MQDESFLSFGGYDLMIEPGERPELIIAVTSLGMPGIRQDFEWIGTCSHIANRRHVMYLRDTRHSWFNAQEGWDALIEAIGAYCTAHDIQHILAFGVSMGAFGAGLLATRLPIDTVLLLAPQVSIDPAVTDYDDRFLSLWQKLPDRPRPDLSGLRTRAVRLYCYFTVDDWQDILHVVLLREHLPACVLTAIRGEHHVAQEMRVRGQHIPLLRYHLGDGDMPDLRPFEGSMDDLFEMADLVASNDFPAMKAWTDRLLRSGCQHQVPGILYPALRWSMRPPKGTLAAILFKLMGRRAYPAHRGVTVRGFGVTSYLLHGWALGEKDGCRAAGPRPSLRVVMTDREIADGVAIQLTGKLVLGDGGARTVRVYQGRRLIGEQTVEGNGEPPLILVAHARGRRIEISIKLDGGTGGDPGFMLTQLRFLHPQDCPSLL